MNNQARVAAGSSEDSPNLKRSALILAVIGSFVPPILNSSLNLALPSIGRHFSLNAVTISWIQTTFLLTTAVALLPAGRLADIHGRRRFYAVGMAALGSACVVAGLAPSVHALFLGMVLMGLACALIFSTGMAILTSVFPPGERGRALGISVAAVYIGLSLGPFVGGLLTQYLTWRSVFFMGLPLSAMAFSVAMWAIKTEWIEAKGEKFDFTGSFFYGAALVVIILGVGRLPELNALWVIMAGFAVLGVFAWWEGRVKAPVFEVDLFKNNRVFALSSLAALINYCATTAVIFLLSLFLQHVKGMSPREAGLVLIAQPIMMALLSPLVGRLSDRIQPRLLSSLGMFLTAVGLFLFSFLDGQTGIPYIILCLVVNGTGFGIFSSPNMNAIMSSVPKRYYGIAAGAVSSMRILGQMASMGIAVSVIAIYVGRVELGPESYPGLIASLRAAFLIFCGLCVLGVVASMTRGRLNQEG